MVERSQILLLTAPLILRPFCLAVFDLTDFLNQLWYNLCRE